MRIFIYLFFLIFEYFIPFMLQGSAGPVTRIAFIHAHPLASICRDFSQGKAEFVCITLRIRNIGKFSNIQ